MMQWGHLSSTYIVMYRNKACLVSEVLMESPEELNVDLTCIVEPILVIRI